MTPSPQALVRLRDNSQRGLGIVIGGRDRVKVRWFKDSAISEHGLHELTSGFEERIEVAHSPSHQGIEALGRGIVRKTRTVAGQVQHLVEFWSRAEARWLPWQRLRASRSVEQDFRRLTQQSGDAESLRLRNLAFALSEWNANAGGLSRLEIDPLPHQLYLVNRILASGDLNWMIADDVGLGKTIEVGLLLAAVRQRSLKRFLIIVPAGLTRQWEEELRDTFMLDDFVIYGDNVHPTTPAHWKLYDRVITSMDRIKSDEHLANIMQADDWDLVVIDEAHRLSRHEYGPEFKTTERYAMAEALRKRTRGMLLLSGTPHQGRDDLFRGLLQLLRPGPSWREKFVSLEQHPEVLSSMIIRNRKADVTDLAGNFIFRGKSTSTIEVQKSDAELSFEHDLINYFRAGYKSAAAKGRSGMAIGFVMTTYRKLAASSTAAIANALKRRVQRLSESIAIDIDNTTEVHEDPETDARYIEAEENIDTGASEFFLGELEAVKALAAQASDLATEDSKIQQFFANVLQTVLADEPNRKVLIFTEYRTTQDTLAAEIRKRFGADSVGLIHGGQAMTERRSTVDRFNRELQFLVSTEAGGEGLNLQRRCNVMVNFDLPWNPMRLVQRVGRLYRYGQKERVVVFNMKAAGTLDQEILSGMYDRLERVAEDMASVTGDSSEGLVEDILGQLIGAIDVSDVLANALQAEESRTQERVEAAILRARQATRAQEELLAYASGFDPDVLDTRIRLTTDHLKTFTESMFAAQGIELHRRLHENDVWEIRLPEAWRKRLNRNQNLRIAFDREKSRLNGGELLDAEHPLLQGLMEVAMNSLTGQAACIVFPDGTQGFTTLVRWLDESGNPVDTEYLALTRDHSGNWHANSDAWLDWLLKPAVSGPPVNGSATLSKSEIDREIHRFLRSEGRRESVPDEPFPISAFLSNPDKR